ncbi:MAG: DegT/DnrJ/EryC1/StrS family aminotransferase [Actinomycetota bacterium]|nr:DegT/DnrJ/EryC1/StrS family aminotransferase [Actinomycetota bacterium]
MQDGHSLTSRIPLVDLAAQHREISDAIWEGFERVMCSSSFVLGEELAAFERAFASFTGVEQCVGVGNGTDALELALRALGIGPGDDVLVPANTFVASALAVSRAGARPVFVDIDPETFLVDVGQVDARITRRTRALIAVHLYGQMAPVEVLREIGSAHSLSVVEDAAQAHGATRDGQGPGRLGVATTSFYPGKNLGALGDGGAVLTDVPEVADRVRALRNYGRTEKYVHAAIGFNSRLDSLQAAVLHAKLERLEDWNARRRAAAAYYDDLLEDTPHVVRSTALPGNLHVQHLYVVRVPARDEVLRRLRASGIEAAIHYPTPIHLQPAYSSLGYRAGDFPAAEEAARQILSLPLHPFITPGQQERVVDELRRAMP